MLISRDTYSVMGKVRPSGRSTRRLPRTVALLLLPQPSGPPCYFHVAGDTSRCCKRVFLRLQMWLAVSTLVSGVPASGLPVWGTQSIGNICLRLWNHVFGAESRQ